MTETIFAHVTGFSPDRIDTPRLIMDALRSADAAALFAYRSDPSVARYQGWCPGSVHEAAEFIAAQPNLAQAAAGQWAQRAIRVREEGTLIGDLGLHFPDEPSGAFEVGISIAPRHQGQGYAREAMTAVFNFAFGAFGFRRAVASVDPRNLRSIALLRDLGMLEEAHHRQSLLFRGEWVDDMIFALLRTEWSRIHGVDKRGSPWTSATAS